MDEDLPHDVFCLHVLDVDKGFEQVNGRNADERHGNFNFDGIGIDLIEPLGQVSVVLNSEPYFRNKGFVATNNDHDQEIRNHDHINQVENDQHDMVFIE